MSYTLGAVGGREGIHLAKIYKFSSLLCLFVCLFWFNVAFNNFFFQSYHDGVWLRQGAQCSLL